VASGWSEHRVLESSFEAGVRANPALLQHAGRHGDLACCVSRASHSNPSGAWHAFACLVEWMAWWLQVCPAILPRAVGSVPIALFVAITVHQKAALSASSFHALQASTYGCCDGAPMFWGRCFESVPVMAASFQPFVHDMYARSHSPYQETSLLITRRFL
jgi:hypothetical protein